MERLWTKEVIDDCKEALGRSESVSEAVELLVDEYDHAFINSDSMRHAFGRYVGQPPSDFVGLPPDEEPENYIIEKSSSYDVCWEGVVYNITEARMKEAVVLYSAKKRGGLGKTASEVCTHFIENGYLPAGVSHKMFHYIFRELEQTKFFSPETTIQQRDQDPLEAASENRHVREALRLSYAGRESERKDYQAFIKKLQKDLDYYLRLDGYLEGIVDGKPLVKEIPRRKILQTGSTLVFMLSDMHSGLKYSAGALSKPRADFDSKVFKERVERYLAYAELVKGICGHRVEHVHFAFIGDNFEAVLANMREGQFLSMDLFGTEQYSQAVEACSLITRKICELFPNTSKDFVVQPGNHDRVTKSRDYHSENLLAACMTREIQKDLQRYGLLDNETRIFFADSAVSVMLPNQVCLISRHGHRGGNSQSSVTTGLKVDKTHSLEGSKRVIQIQGHFHNLQVRRFDNILMVTNPSFCGNSDYNIEDLNLTAPPEFIAIESCQNTDLIHGPFNLLSDKI